MSQPQYILNNGMWMTFTEIVDDLEMRMSLADKKKLAKIPAADIGKYHHGFGTWIRNSYGLWGDPNGGNPLTEQWRINQSSRKIINGVDHSDDHPDALSMRIIEAFHQRIQYLNKP